MFKQILVPLDGSARSEEVLPFVLQLMEGGATHVTLFRVDETPRAVGLRRRGLRRPLPLAGSLSSYPTGVIDAAAPTYVESKDQAVERREHELLEYLDEAGRPLLGMDRTVQAAVHFGDPAQQIIAFARRSQCDLIAMATHGHSGLREALHGSVTAAVIRSGVAPVLVVRPKDTHEHEGASVSC